MTTIILTIIGILLAAAAALMVIFYGGDAFNAGSIGAQANTYQNAGTNVISALQLAKADGVLDMTKVTSPSALHDPQDPNLDYLKELPSLAGVADADQVISDTGRHFEVKVAGTDAERVCGRINRNLKINTGTALATVDNTKKMGCFGATGAYTFFANA